MPIELPAFFLGLLLGSFLNVCISRLPEHLSISRPRSHCPNCLATIRWYDNIPLLSWILLAAKCRHCKAAIPWRYPLVELATGLWFGISAYIFAQGVYGPPGVASVNLIFTALNIAVLGFLLIGLLVTDWQTHTLPDAFTYPGIAIGFVLVCCQAIFLPRGYGDIHLHANHVRLSSPGAMVDRGDVFMTGPETLVLGRLAAICGAALLLWAIRALYQAVRHREGMGVGDIKLLAMIAAFLGFWPAVLSFFIGAILASLHSVVLLLRRRANALTRLPFGTFLSLGALFTALVGEAVLTWYKSLL
jgi:leader peptidase (prepilin peptidase)/N-methyltransferase